MPTNGNGACAIHSVWGIEDEASGELVKSNARLFLRDAFGPTAEGFKRKVASVDLMDEIEMALWELIEPVAKQSGIHGPPPNAGNQEGRHVWKCLVRSSSTVAERCVRAGQEDAERFRVYRERKDKVIQEFGVLCVDDFREVFVKPLLGTLDLLEKYENEASTVRVEGAY